MLSTLTQNLFLELQYKNQYWNKHLNWKLIAPEYSYSLRIIILIYVMHLYLIKISTENFQIYNYIYHTREMSWSIDFNYQHYYNMPKGKNDKISEPTNFF